MLRSSTYDLPSFESILILVSVNMNSDCRQKAYPKVDIVTKKSGFINRLDPPTIDISESPDRSP